MFDPAETAAAAFENEATGHWEVEVYFSAEPDEDLIRSIVGPTAAQPLRPRCAFDAIDEKDWVKASLEGLAPVPAGRFVVHGSHDRGRSSRPRHRHRNRGGARFGTGHHGTTRGCLLFLDDIPSAAVPQRVLDVGTRDGRSRHRRRPGAAPACLGWRH